MRGIDVSSWNGWPFNGVTEQGYHESDFVITKATQGTGYVNPCCDPVVQRCKADGKLFGFYHYAGGGDAVAEANYFYNACKNYFGHGIPCLDWESEQNAAWGSTSWCRRFVDRIHELTGIWCMVYVQASAVGQCGNCAKDCALWIAGYPDMRTSWNVPSFPYGTGAWPTYTLWQYTSGGGLDRNTAQIDRAGWQRIAGADDVNKQQPGKPVNDSGMYYRLHVQNLGWLDSVRDGQVAGTTGNAYQAEAIKIKPPKGMVLNVKAHMADYGWRTYKGIDGSENSGTGSSAHDPIIGTVGKSLGLQAIEIDVTKNPKNLKVSYRVHVGGFGWGPWIPAGYTAGTTGIDRSIEAIQIKAV